MLDNKGFDLWADGYDESVGISDEENLYPFAGYKEILARIYKTVLAKGNPVILDIGFGTGTLTSRLYGQGCEVWGQDFSDKMIELASAKMPKAHLFCGDFSKGLVEPVMKNSYDFIIATYSMHHLTDDGKSDLIRTMQGLLAPDGVILIGDVAFATREEMERCSMEAGEEWDDEEIYFVIEEMKKIFPDIEFEQVSYCAGLLSLKR